MRPQAQVHVEDALLARGDDAGDLAHDGLEEDAGVNARALGPPREAVDDHELDVGRVAHLAPAELAEAEDGDRRHRAALVPRRSVAARHLVEACPERARDDGFGEIRDGRGERHQVHLRIEQVPHVGEQHLLVLEGVQRAALLLEARGAREARLEVALQLVPPAQRARAPAVEHGQQVLGLAAQEVLPEKGARAEQAGQLAEPLGRGDER